MKMIIRKVKDRVNFARELRKEFPKFTLQQAFLIKDIEYVSELQAKILKEKWSYCAEIELELERSDSCYYEYNMNINPPQIYIDATAWYETLSDLNKSYVDAIHQWRVRPAAC